MSFLKKISKFDKDQKEMELRDDAFALKKRKGFKILNHHVIELKKAFGFDNFLSRNF